MSPSDSVEPRSTEGRSLAPVLAYFALTFGLTLPIWIASAATGLQLMPGLPVAAFAVLCPATSALVLAYLGGGWTSAAALLGRAFDPGRIRPAVWWTPLILIMPAVSVAAFCVMRLTGSAVPNPQIALGSSALLFLVFLIGALAEELGWSGFAIEPMQARWGALPAALLLGAVWSVWHYPALLQAHRSASWIGSWTLGSLALRVLIVWLFNNTHHSVFAAALFHTISNLCWQLFPVRGSWFDPRLNGLLLAAIALVAIFFWGPRTLSSWGWLAPKDRAEVG